MIEASSTYKIAVSRYELEGKIPQGDSRWHAFNGSFENRELPLIDIANEIYMGKPFTTWHGQQWRKGDNYICGQHIGIDFDTEDYRSSIDYLAKEELIRQYGAIIYTTPSHKPNAPKARALFLLDSPIMQAKNYVLACQAMLWVFQSADEKCKDPCRFFYGSQKCDVEWIGNTMPLGFLKHLIGEYKRTGQETRRRQQAQAQQDYRPTTEQQAEVASALKSIDPWGMDYDEWVGVLMAVHSAFPGNDGLSMASQWGQGKGNEVERKWNSFNEQGNYAGKVTLATLFKHARSNGWQGMRNQ